MLITLAIVSGIPVISFPFNLQQKTGGYQATVNNIRGFPKQYILMLLACVGMRTDTMQSLKPDPHGERGCGDISLDKLCSGPPQTWGLIVAAKSMAVCRLHHSFDNTHLTGEGYIQTLAITLAVHMW